MLVYVPFFDGTRSSNKPLDNNFVSESRLFHSFLLEYTRVLASHFDDGEIHEKMSSKDRVIKVKTRMQCVSWYKIDKTVSSPYDGEFTKGVQEIVKMEAFFGQDESLKGRDEQHSAQLSPGLNSLLARENKMDGIKCPNQRLLCV